ncbi:MAG: LLM class F420-dependent oxidoreductase [Chloroflexi bacterium]|nr:LLM class F420-dependent oxidoreductase [Chloroflexota bacterium]HEV8054520.1 LLM class F420-dependent oxidoreductase [Candidatus Limnocylindrales bacterium]
MKLGLQISSFTWPGGDAELAATLARVVRTADEVGFDSIWVMDHFFQIRSVGRPEEPMLEGFTALGYAAALTKRARLGLMVGGIHYRQAGLWLKAASTLDVLAGGRSYFGIGAAWNEQESRGLGFPFPELRERFEMLEETLRIVHEAWGAAPDAAPAFEGRRYQASQLLNSPQPLSKPHPPILIGGGGERKTLRLVAQYADACNIFGGPEQLRHKYDVLLEHCERFGRDYATIEKTNLTSVSITPDGAGGSLTPAAFIDRLGGWADAGSMHTIFSVRDAADVSKLELIGRDVIPQVRELGERSPID